VSVDKLSTCCTCGYQWEAGKDGSHSCSSELGKCNYNMRTVLLVLRDTLQTLFDLQNGPPLYKDQREWTNAMAEAERILEIVECIVIREGGSNEN
jgi:hypothetical protein